MYQYLKNQFSVCDPKTYAKRFKAFMKKLFLPDMQSRPQSSKQSSSSTENELQKATVSTNNNRTNSSEKSEFVNIPDIRLNL